MKKFTYLSGLILSLTILSINGQNLITNGAFNSGTGSWSENVSNGGAGTFSVVTENENNVGLISATALGTESYHIQLLQGNVTLGQNKWYTLSFRAKSSVDGIQMKTGTGLSVSPYNSYFGNIITLSTSWKTYTVNFSTSPTWFPVATPSTNQLALQFGLNLGDFYFDDIEIVEIPNLLLNGDFISSTSSWFEVIDNAAAASFVSITENDNIVAKFTSSTLGSASYSIQLLQNTVALAQNKWYALSFYAKSSEAGNQIKTSVGLSVSPYYSYYTNTFTLSTSWAYYTVNFQTSAEWFPVSTPSNHQISLQCGLNLGDFYFDDVTLVEITPPTITKITSGDSKLSVAFTAPLFYDINGSEITNYQYSTDGGTSFTACSPAQTTSPIVILGLTNGTAYNVQIKAVNAAGEGTATPTTVATPTGPTAINQIIENSGLYVFEGVVRILNPKLVSTDVEIYSLTGSLLKKGNLNNGQISVSEFGCKAIIIRYKNEVGQYKSQLLIIN